MIPDIYINDISMSRMGWIRENIDFPIPKSQTETVVVPGRNSPIRFTEALGSISFEPRAFTVNLSMLGTREKFNELVKVAGNQFSGRLAKVICSEEPGLYCIGTLQLTPSYDPLTGKGQLVMECTDGDSYRYHVDETVIVQNGSGTVILKNAVAIANSTMINFRALNNNNVKPKNINGKKSLFLDVKLNNSAAQYGKIKNKKHLILTPTESKKSCG